MSGKAVIKPDADEILTAALTPFDQTTPSAKLTNQDSFKGFVKTERRASDSDESNVARVEAKRKADSLYK